MIHKQIKAKPQHYKTYNRIISLTLSLTAMLLTADTLIPALIISRGCLAFGGEVILFPIIGLAVYHLLMQCMEGGKK